ncbi:hypothetical protein GCM10025768_10080 [Microbacterium pseudoresistens]|uniref:Maleylpyruvate isomerase n=1 Tax=Microbacterium pseudoresistens TaxID=640634 RepID=A0A7Y9EW44_9MICO|nr:maleylpyruvate isomerase N-terminal domain-containing protein [Microbacterium pseudoresistens]NYD54911.1 maleylpyruvate isomerase [Microbacterium pseudoresistens]
MVRREDRTQDPRTREDLALARLAQAYFSRALNELDDDELYAPSARDGWTRAHIVAHIGYHARGVARLVEWAETGVRQEMYESSQAHEQEVEFGATLSPRALRHLSDHASVQLDVAWRDLPAERWHQRVATESERDLPISATPMLRAAELWRASLDLDHGARMRDAPERVRAVLGAPVTG